TARWRQRLHLSGQGGPECPRKGDRLHPTASNWISQGKTAPGMCTSRVSDDTVKLPVTSMVGSKAANGGQVKTGQRMWPGTQMFYPVVCILGKPNHNCWFCSLTFLWCRGGSTRSPHERAEAEARNAVKDAERGTSGAPRSGL